MTIPHHPLDDPKFGTTIDEPVWYLSHPLAPDDVMDYAENMASVSEFIAFFYRNGIRVVAPYFEICFALNDDDPEMRRVGLEVDLHMCKLLRRIICVGHKMSRGMAIERTTVEKEIDEYLADWPRAKDPGCILNFVGLSKADILDKLAVLKIIKQSEWR